MVLAICLRGPGAPAAEPKLTHLYPAGGAAGSTANVEAKGELKPWPPQVWIDGPGIIFRPAASEGTFDVDIAPDAAPGPHLVRLFNAEGVSAPRFFVVSSEPVECEAERNDDWKVPQRIANLPVVIDGRLDKTGDVDSFSIALRKGETLIASLEAYILASTFDGLIRVLDPDGIQLAFNHDGRTLDPELVWTAPHDGMFVVQLMGFVYPASSSTQLTGGEGCVYRLHLTSGPFVRSTRPLAVERGKATPLELAGWNLPVATTAVDGTLLPEGVTRVGSLPPNINLGVPLLVSDFPETLELETSESTTAQALEVPSAVTGRIERANDEDRFTFTALKDRTYHIRITAARVGARLDAWLTIHDKEGKELARDDDSEGSADPGLTWKAPADEVFAVTVGDVTHRGGDDFFYRLAVTDAVPSVAAKAMSHSVTVAPGKTGEIKVAVKLANDFKGKLQLAARDLPDGISAEPAEVPEKGGEVSLKITAPADAKPQNQAVALVLRETASGAEYPVPFFLTSAGEDNGVPHGYSELVIGSTTQLWLTVPVPAK